MAQVKAIHSSDLYEPRVRDSRIIAAAQAAGLVAKPVGGKK